MPKPSTILAIMRMPGFRNRILIFLNLLVPCDQPRIFFYVVYPIKDLTLSIAKGCGPRAIWPEEVAWKRHVSAPWEA